MNVDLGGFALLRNEVGRCDQVDRVSEGGILADLGKKLHSILSHFYVLFLTTNVKNLLDLPLIVRVSGDDQGTIKKIEGETVRAQVVCSSNLGDTSIGGHDNDGSLIAFKSSVQE